MQIKTRVAGVLAVTAAAVAMVGGPAFASNSPSVGNVTGIGNFSLASGNYIEAPTFTPTDFCGNALAFLGFAEAGCQGGVTVIDDSGNTSGGHHHHGFGF